VEGFYEKNTLFGGAGLSKVEFNASRRIMSRAGKAKPTPGKRFIFVFSDARLPTVNAYDLLGGLSTGSVVAIDPTNWRGN